MEMLLLSFAGSMLAYFAFLSSASSAASAQAATATNWPPTSAQQLALQQQIGALVAEVTGQPLSTKEQNALQALLASAPQQFQASLPSGAKPTYAGYAAWVLAGSAGTAAASMSPGYPNVYGASGASSSGPLGVTGGNPNPSWDVYGNAWFTDEHGKPVVVFHSNFAPGDYIRHVNSGLIQAQITG